MNKLGTDDLFWELEVKRELDNALYRGHIFLLDSLRSTYFMYVLYTECV